MSTEPRGSALPGTTTRGQAAPDFTPHTAGGAAPGGHLGCKMPKCQQADGISMRLYQSLLRPQRNPGAGLDCFRFIFLPKIKAWEDNCRNIKRDFGKFPENASCELRPGSGPEGGGSGSRLHQAGSLLLTGSRPHGAGMAASAHAPAGPYLPRPAMPCTTGLAQCGTQRPHRRR